MKDLKERAIRGGFSRILAQVTTLVLRLGSLMILARLLGPKEFGLVSMVTVFTGVLSLFRDFGLSAAVVQRTTVTEEQSSSLFWINVSVGAFLSLLAILGAPAVAHFYHEPRLVGVTIALSFAFVFNSAGVQHSALLQREMRFTAMAVINIVALLLSSVIAVVGAWLGYGYWALVAMAVTLPLFTTIGFWIATPWMPGMPRRNSGIRSILHFGGILTLNSLVVYAAANSEKLLIGRFWGVTAIGIYGRAYQLINIPNDSLNTAVGEVAFSALSRVKDDRPRFRSYFLKGYSLVVGLTLPITIACALFSDDVVNILLGPKWTGTAIIFRLLAPTIAIFAIINPLGWLLNAQGNVTRGLKIALVTAPITIAGYALGIPYGPKGVAFCFSVVMLLRMFPQIAVCTYRSGVSMRDVLTAASRPVFAGFVAGAAGLAFAFTFGKFMPSIARLILENAVLILTYFGILVFVTDQKSLYLALFKGWKPSSAVAADEAVTVDL